MEQATTVEEVLTHALPGTGASGACVRRGQSLDGVVGDTAHLRYRSAHFTVFEERPAPGKPVSLVAVGEELRGVLSEGGEDDHRFIRRYIPGHGFKERDKLACPDDTGSFLAYDGESLWLSQRFNRRILLLDANANVRREITAGGQILGITFVDGALYASLWYGKEGGPKLGRVNGDSVDVIASLPFAAISLAHDGSRFWCNDPKTTSIVAFTF